MTAFGGDGAAFDDALPSLATQIMHRCDQLAACSDDPHCLTRTFASPALAECHRLLAGWMQAAGLKCRTDAACNLVARYASPEPEARVLLIGSHVDTVPNAGRYDGPLGVLLGLAALEVLAERNAALPFHVDLLAFSDEEGVRYGVPFLGSRAVSGAFTADLLDRRDADGVTLREAIARFGQDPEQIAAARYLAGDVVGYLEPHIEQGPILERLDLPVGVVTAIAGQTRASIRFDGTAGHAGTVPIDQRRDALAAAAHFIAEVERHAAHGDGLVATVGRIEVQPNVANVIPSGVQLSLDVRHERDDVREAAVEHLVDFADQLATGRRLRFGVEWTESHNAVPMDETLTESLAASIAETGRPVHRMVSGAGHDAVRLAEIAPAAMLFVRCEGGISHHPREAVDAADVAVALDVLLRTILRLEGRGNPVSHEAGTGECAHPDSVH